MQYEICTEVYDSFSFLLAILLPGRYNYSEYVSKRVKYPMEQKKHILLLTTGGTIACRPGEEGLEPQSADILLRQIEQLRSYYDISVQDVMCLDSSNIRPEEWQRIARHIFTHKDAFDGIVISHGTDTMAYTASAVTFMLPGIDKPVVFTGSQLPLEDTLSDAPDNLRTAFAMAAAGYPGVFVAFDQIGRAHV